MKEQRQINILVIILTILAAMAMAFVFGCTTIRPSPPTDEPIGPYHHRDAGTYCKNHWAKNQPTYKYYTYEE